MDMITFSLGLLVGMVLGIGIMGVGVYFMLKRAKEGKSVVPKGMTTGALGLALIVVATLSLMLGNVTPILAQETPVPLVIPINSIFIQANNWLQTLSPIASLGIGIIIALAVFGFLSKAIKSAFG